MAGARRCGTRWRAESHGLRNAMAPTRRLRLAGLRASPDAGGRLSREGLSCQGNDFPSSASIASWQGRAGLAGVCDMVWLLRQRLRFFLRSSLWFYPLLSIGAALFAAPALRRVDDWTGWTLPISIDGVRAVVGTLTSTLLSFIVFVFSVLLVAVQIASAQLTPR